MYGEKTNRMDQQELLEHYEQMKQMAAHDSLTGLYNRGELERQIQSRLQKMGREDKCALFIVDLDNFKPVNDTLGHQAGDHVIIQVAKLLAELFSPEDVVGRLGGDEFIVFLCGNVNEELVREKGKLICEQLQLVMGQGADLIVTASVGIYLSADTEHSFSHLYRMADLALYQAKNHGKQCFCVRKSGEDSGEETQEQNTPVNAVRLRGLLDYIDSGVAMIEVRDPMRFLYVSPTFARMLGVSEETLLQTPAIEFLYPGEQDEARRLLRTKVMEQNETVSHVLRVQHQDGTMMWWRMHAVRVEYNEKKPVILVTVIDITELKKEASDLRKSNDLFRLAVDQRMQGIWEIELNTKLFRLISESECFHSRLSEPTVFPDGLLQSGWIAGESEEAFRNFSEEIFGGRLQGYGNFLIRFQDTDEYRWASFSYRTVLDDVGRSIRAVGIIEGMECEAEKPESGVRSRRLPEGLMSSLVLQVTANLTQDTVRHLWMEGRDRKGAEELQTCTGFLLHEKQKMFQPEILLRFPDYFTREGLIGAYQEKHLHWLAYEYRRIDDGGTIHWVLSTVNLYQDPSTGDVRMAAWLSTLDSRMAWEAESGLQIQKDPATKLYKHTTVQELTRYLLDKKPYSLCALVLIEVGGITRLYAQDALKLEEQWKAMIKALLLAVGTHCIPGQCGKDRFVLFFPDISGKEMLQRKLEQAFLFVRNVTADLIEGNPLRFVAGVVPAYYEDRPEYSLMMKRAQALCSLWGNTSGDRVAFADEEEEDWESLRRAEKADQIRVPHEDIPRPLTEREKDAALRCVLSMLSAESLEDSARCVLRTLGEYYEADRAYILVLVEYGHIVTMPHEWTSEKKNSIQHIVSGTVVSNFPMLMRCEKEGRPVFLTRQGPGEESGPGKKKESWHFAVFPMQNGNCVQGYLCIENAHINAQDTALPMLLGSSLLKERKKYLKNSRQPGGEYGIYGMNFPSFGSYMESIFRYNSDVCSTLGVVCVDVPVISVLNESQGFEYGRKLLWYITRMMTDVFGKEMLFRTWDAEFVAICPNTTQQVFFGKCARLRAILTRRYPKEVRIGFTWSDGVFSGKSLADEARVLMRCDHAAETPDSFRELYLPGQTASGERAGGASYSDRFTVFFQPKINMTTGELIGAEALVRGIDEAGNLVPPDRFIEEAEQNGSIRDLDLLVLDRTMALLDGWRKEARRLVPVSVNFSRVTLFDTGAPASLLAIQSRYPQVEPGLIEIEITESAGNVGQEILKKVMGQFREFGVTFSLDDFGSQYSNLAVFTNIHFETVKLDRSFVAEVVRNEKSRMLVREIAQICRRSGMRCIAEGVETMDQVLALTEAGCIFAQGYYYDRPLPADKYYEKYLIGS